MPDIFDQIHAEASPAAGGDVFDQIHADSGGFDLAHPQLGPSPQAARIGNEMFRNLANLPAGVMAFIRHPIETTKAAVGQMDIEHPEKSSGLLGLPDVLYREWQANQQPEALAHLAEVAAPGLLRGGGEAAAATAPGVIGTAIRGGIKGGIGAVPNAIETSLLRYTGLPQIGRGIISGAKKELAQRGATQTAMSPGIRALVQAAQKAPAPESVLPESVSADLTRPSEMAQSPAEAMTQLNTKAAKPIPTPAPVVPIATRMAATARAARAGNADTLAQGLQDIGISADMADTIPRFKWRDIARAHGVDWPASSDAQFNLIRDTRAALRQRTTKP